MTGLPSLLHMLAQTGAFQKEETGRGRWGAFLECCMLNAPYTTQRGWDSCLTESSDNYLQE